MVENVALKDNRSYASLHLCGSGREIRDSCSWHKIQSCQIANVCYSRVNLGSVGCDQSYQDI